MQSIAPLLIVLRVAQGRGWTTAKVKETEQLALGTQRTIPLTFMQPSLSATNASSTVREKGLVSEEGQYKEGSSTSLPSHSGIKVEHVVDV